MFFECKNNFKWMTFNAQILFEAPQKRCYKSQNNYIHKIKSKSKIIDVTSNNAAYFDFK